MSDAQPHTSAGWGPVGLILDGEDWEPGEIGFIVKTDGRGVTINDLRKVAAAPEMYEALKALLPEGWGDDDTMDHMPGVKLARAALAKADGSDV